MAGHDKKLDLPERSPCSRDYYTLLRKPDFQRETSEWSPAKVAGLIESFVVGDLIPAVILWHDVGGSYVFVIDGGHRLSALAAWVNDDYGDGDISKSFYGEIPEDQKKVAVQTRRQIAKTIGTYADYQFALRNPDSASVTPPMRERANRVATHGIAVQYVEGNARKAEQSFRQINQQGTPINKTEQYILKARRSAVGIAAHAIVHSARGHKYWDKFPPPMQGALERLAGEVHALLFDPPLASPIKAIDLPIGGKANAAQSLALVLELIGLVNEVEDIADPEKMPEDLDGSLTMKYMQRCKQVAEFINSNEKGSLGLHPIVYFYSPQGRHKPASFYAAVSFVETLGAKKKVDDFIAVRGKFEQLLLAHEYISQQIVRNARGASGGTETLRDYWMRCIDLLKTNDVEKTVEIVLKEFGVLGRAPTSGEAGKAFTTAVKESVYITEGIDGASRCPECGGLIDPHAATVDHRDRREDGGSNDASNGQLMHPYCNTGYKEKQVARERADTSV